MFITFDAMVVFEVWKSIYFLQSFHFFPFYISLSVSHKYIWILIKFVIFGPKFTVFCWWHKNDKIYSRAQKIIINHLKYFFWVFGGHVNAMGWKKKALEKNFFSVEICSFLQKNAIFRPFLFSPYPFFGRKQTKCQNFWHKCPKYPKSFPKKIW